ncbi:hypothetical protein Q669_29030 [Labrenzia sp. C1B10]|nr:hypothetical protein Q669_29030 [Labrenzia sp. C1B10]ERS06934.1 hypothetical protein Q675_24890 [Labrenzia sp. C1B70]
MPWRFLLGSGTLSLCAIRTSKITETNSKQNAHPGRSFVAFLLGQLWRRISLIACVPKNSFYLDSIRMLIVEKSVQIELSLRRMFTAGVVRLLLLLACSHSQVPSHQKHGKQSSKWLMTSKST